MPHAPIAPRSARRAVALAGMLLATMAVAGAPAVSAKDGDVVRTGSCTAASDWKLKLSPEDGRIEVEFEVDSNVNGQTWTVVLRDNGDLIQSTARTTQAPSGSFEYRRTITNRAGADNVTVNAKNRTTGEKCKGAATF